MKCPKNRTLHLFYGIESSYLVCPVDPLSCHNLVRYKLLSVKIHAVHIHRRDLMILIGRIIIDAL